MNCLNDKIAISKSRHAGIEQDDYDPSVGLIIFFNKKNKNNNKNTSLPNEETGGQQWKV